jgi:hypothetical protein
MCGDWLCVAVINPYNQSPQNMRRMYIYQLSEWPHFHWDGDRLVEPLVAVRHCQGRLIGHMEALGFNLRQEAELEALTAEVLKSSEIEGESLDAEQVRSSIARRLGINVGARKAADRDVEGVVEMTLDATQAYKQPLTPERLFAWHATLFPTGRSGMHKIAVGRWRDGSSGPMQVVSSPDAAAWRGHEQSGSPLPSVDARSQRQRERLRKKRPSRLAKSVSISKHLRPSGSNGRCRSS